MVVVSKFVHVVIFADTSLKKEFVIAEFVIAEFVMAEFVIAKLMAEFVIAELMAESELMAPTSNSAVSLQTRVIFWD